jgi:hypothetical protein
VSDRPDQGAENLVVRTVQDLCSVAVEVVAFDRELDPNLRFCSFAFRIAQLTDESSLIAPLAPGIG